MTKLQLTPAGRRASTARAPGDPGLKAQAMKKLEKKKLRWLKMPLALEGKPSEYAAKQFDEALKKKTRDDILRELKFIIGTKGGKGKMDMKNKKQRLRMRLKLKFLKSKKKLTEMEVALEELTGASKKKKSEDP